MLIALVWVNYSTLKNSHPWKSHLPEKVHRDRTSLGHQPVPVMGKVAFLHQGMESAGIHRTTNSGGSVTLIWDLLVLLCVSVTQPCSILCDPVDCSPPGSSVRGILQARTLEWVAISFSRGSSPPRDQTQVFCIAGGFFTVWDTREAQFYLNVV